MLKMMIVDDSNIIRSKISRVSSGGKFDIVATATDGIDALDKFRQFRPDVITMDLTMPHMEGPECISNLVEIDPEVQILVISALSDEATGIEALERGAQGFLLKPFTDDELSQALDELTEEAHV